MTMLGWLTLYTLAWVVFLAPLHFVFTRQARRRSRREIDQHRRMQRHVFGRR